MHLASLVEDLREKLRAAGSEERAIGAKAYLKNDLEFYGVPSKRLRAAVRDLLTDNPDLEKTDLKELVATLWQDPVFDMRGAAIAVLERRQRELDASDLELVESLLRSSYTWALVDWISTKVVAPVVSREPVVKDRLRRWSGDDDFWLRRAAMLSLLPDLRAGGGDFDLFASFAVPMLEEKEFFIRKAIGWVLRDTSRRRPELVAGFVREHRTRMSPLTYREATRNLPPELREALDVCSK
ncbi:MAG: DNA alkylation repair protein [Acidobacteriota bacterium]